MGNLLGSPKSEKDTHTGVTTDGLKFGVSSMQGWRVHMEDAHLAETHVYAKNGDEVISLRGHSIFGVFDGHGGTFAAKYSGNNFCRVLSLQPKFLEYAKFEQVRCEHERTLSSPAEVQNYRQTGITLLEEAFFSTFVELDREIALALKGSKVLGADTPYNSEDASPDGTAATNMEEVEAKSSDEAESEALRLLQEEGESGTTVSIVMVAPEFIVCANAGDSRSVMSREKRVVELSYDHKPQDEGEEKRIREAGGYVAGGRVEGDLAVSRGLGDFRFKNLDVVMRGTDGSTSANTSANEDSQPLVTKPEEQKVSPKPDIIFQGRNKAVDNFIVVACDGIWDVMSNQECIKEVADMFDEGESDTGLICEELCDVCLEKGSKDNMTALVVKLEAQEVAEGGGVKARRQKREENKEEEKDDAGSPA